MNERTARSWKDEHAVSPIIAVILMVAITVVLAATVFVLVSDIGGTPSIAPEISFREDQQADTLTVLKAATGLTWSDFTVAGCTAPAGTETVDAGDQLTACVGRVTVTHTSSNQLVYEGQF